MRKLFSRLALALALIAAPAFIAQATTPDQRVLLFSGKIKPVATLDFTSQTYKGQCASFSACVTFTRASQDTDSFYTDAAGSSYNTYSTNVPVITSAGFYVWEPRTQYVTSPASPANQTVTLTTGAHVLWAIGTGTVTIAAGTGSATGLGTHTPGTPLVFTVTVGGTFTLTKSGSLDRFQLEKGSFPTAFMPGASRAATVAQVAGALASGLLSISGTLISEIGPFSGSSYPDALIIGSNLSFAQAINSSNKFKVDAFRSAGATADTVTISKTAVNRVGVAWGAATFSLSTNGNAVVAGSGTTAFSGTAYLGAYSTASGFINGPIRSLAFYNVRIPDATFRTKTTVGASYAANDNGVRFAFANDNLPTHWRIAL